MVDMIYYIWADVLDYRNLIVSFIGGNDGNFVYLGFKPAVLWIVTDINRHNIMVYLHR